MTEEDKWYERFFGEDYLTIYGPQLPPERTVAEVEGIARLLELPPGSHILDLCCGHGRHAVPLAQRGYHVTGQDLNEAFLERARAAADEAGVAVRWVHRDMRDVPFEAEFDAVINVFTAFGYLESEADDVRVLEQVCKALKPGGRFLVETLHRDALVRGFQAHGISRHEGGRLVLEERHFDQLSGRIDVRVTLLHPDGRRAEYRHKERIYSITELARLLQVVGLELEAHYGGLAGNPLTLDSRRLVLLSRSPAGG